VAERRLIDSSELPLERELLRTASAECAPLAVRRRALGTLGLLRVITPTVRASTPPATHSGFLRLSHWFAKVGLVIAIGTAVGVVVASAARIQLRRHGDPAWPDPGPTTRRTASPTR